MNPEFRPLRHTERRLLDRLFEWDFPRKDELRKQLESLLVRTVDEDGSLALSPAPGSVSAQDKMSHEGESADSLLKQRIPVEGRYFDADGIPVSVLLHVVNGALYELEILKADGSPPISPPTGKELVLGSPTAGSVVPPGALW